MRIFTRYILKEVLSNAVIGASLFTFIIFMRDLWRILEVVVRASAPLPSVAEIFFFTLPTVLTVTLPMGALVGILIGLSRLAADSEVTAMRASGLGAGTFVKIISIFAIAAWMLALVNSVWVAPKSAAALGRLQDRLKASQASFEIQPRVFYEDFKNIVLYVQDVKSGAGASVWKGVFLADVTNPSAPRITLAQQGLVINDGPDHVRLHLMNGSQQEAQPRNPEQYSISTFTETDIPIQIRSTDNVAKKDLVPVAEMTTPELWYRANHPEGGVVNQTRKVEPPEVRARWYRVEFHRRLALPTACLVLALVGVPLGLSSRKGGKSTGFVLAILLVLVYYLVSLSGISFGRSAKISPLIGVWGANVVFLLAGLFLLWRVDRRPIEIGSPRALLLRMRDRLKSGTALHPEEVDTSEAGAFERAVSRRRLFSARFPLILDDLILRDFALYLALILGSFIMLTLVFTFFELLGDIMRNRISFLTMGDYLLNVTPSMIYLMMPLSVMLAVLITFGLMQKSSEITAMKATGISIYRIILPILVIAGILSAALFFFDQFFIPGANQRQETLRNTIKGRPAQTYLRPDRKWIFGEHHSIYYYELFDPDQNRFGGLSMFVFDPDTFQLTKRVYATRARWEDSLQKWVFEQGWERTFRDEAIHDYKTFDVTTLAQATEPPGYFKKEVKQSSEMNSEELRAYIRDLQQSGFDVVRLRVQLHKKFAYPVITFVMAVLAVPFSLSAGRRGALTGVAVAIGVAMVYWVTSGLFEAMGNANYLPAALAAWAPDLLFGLGSGYLVLKVRT